MLVDSEPADPVQIVASEVVLLAEAEPVISVLIAESVLRVAPLYFVALEQRCFVGSVDVLVRQHEYLEM